MVQPPPAIPLDETRPTFARFHVSPSLLPAAAVVAAAYWVGANIGLILRLPPTTPSVLWPPNSTLTATLLLWPVRSWWVFLVAVLPAHVAAELPMGWPPALILALYVTNCLEAVIAAGLVRRFSDAPTRFDTLRRAAVFMAAVGVSALVTTAVDAAAVWSVLGEPYGHVFLTRLSSNVLTGLTLVPTIVSLVVGMPSWLRRVSARRRAEAVLLAVSSCTITLLVFGLGGIAASIPGAPVTPMVLLLPFILWATVRFGPPGTSLSLLAIALLASSAATYETGPFAGAFLAERVLALQMALVVVAVPMLCLAALLEERRGAERALVERLGFEELLSRLSGAFVHLTSAEMGWAFQRWFAQVGEFLGLARITLAPTLADGAAAPGGSSWRGADVRGDESIVVVPLAAGDRVLGNLTFAKSPADGAWSDDLRQRVRLVAEVFASALARKESEDALRASEVMKSAILASLASGVAVLDRRGSIIAVNDAWTRLAREHAAPGAVGAGVNYLDACRAAARRAEPHAAELAAGVQAVLFGGTPGCTVEYARTAGGEGWLAVTVVPLHRPEGGAVVSQTDVTERKHAEMDAQRSRQELAHFSRVSTMGELSASLAHELNQPLTGILINAQTARRFLDADPPAIDEVREILSDIVDDDTRAAEVIHRLRELLRKGETERVRLDLNALIRDVMRLLGSDAVIRNVALALECAGEPLMVRGDRIQLQQVVLNLLLNAMEAVADGAGIDRRIVVRTERHGDVAEVSVRDAGPGLREGTCELVFEPFYTTKPSGMGMGLSIVRSIIRMHDGAISVANNPTGGATFRFDLPAADAEAA